MRKTKKLLLILSLVIISSLIAPLFIAYADSPAPPNYFHCYVTNADSNVTNTDILIKINNDSPNYTDFNTSNSNAQGFDSSAQIVTYNQDGYMSLSFHYKNVDSLRSVQREDLSIEKHIILNNGYKPISTITNSIKIALLDKDGNVLKVSDAVSIMPKDNTTYPRSVNYNAAGETPKITFAQYYSGYNNNYSIVISTLFILAFLARMLISTSIETLIAVPFKIKPFWKIVVVNIVTQLLLLLLLAFGGLSYINAVIIGEILVYISEFAAYIFLYKNISKRRLALYTIVANSASLAVGLIFNIAHILVV